MRLGARSLRNLTVVRDEATLLWLIAAGTAIYAGSVLLLFGKRWLSGAGAS